VAQNSVPVRLPDGFGLNREVRRCKVDLTLDINTAAANDTAPLVILPQGGNFKLIPHLSRVSWQGAATTLTVSIIDSAGNVLMAAVDALTAGGINFSGEDLEVAVPADGIIRAKLATEAASAIGDVGQFFLAFVQE
jgi:hypothetical protein